MRDYILLILALGTTVLAVALKARDADASLSPIRKIGIGGGISLLLAVAVAALQAHKTYEDSVRSRHLSQAAGTAALDVLYSIGSLAENLASLSSAPDWTRMEKRMIRESINLLSQSKEIAETKIVAWQASLALPTLEAFQKLLQKVEAVTTGDRELDETSRAAIRSDGVEIRASATELVVQICSSIGTPDITGATKASSVRCPFRAFHPQSSLLGSIQRNRAELAASAAQAK